MRPYHPSDGGANQGEKLAAEEIVKRGKRIAELVEELRGKGCVCENCGGQLAHYRLCGYRCLRGCQQ